MDNSSRLQKILIYALFFLFFVLIVLMMLPYSTVFLWAALLYILLKPFYRKCHKKLNPDKKFYDLKRYLLAAVFSLGTLILIITPLSIILINLTQQTISFLQKFENYFISNPDLIEESFLAEKLTQLAEKFNIDVSFFDFDTLEKQILSFIRTSSVKLFSVGKTIVTKTGAFITTLLFIVFALYFLFLDGPYLIGLIKKAVPINPKHMDILSKKFSDIIKNLFSGYILVALFQGIVAFIILSCFKVEGALLLAFILMFASFVPLFGAAIIWFPVGIILCVTRSLFSGILFLILSAICISFLDNFLRPFFLKDRINVHPLVIFFSILGGINFYGLNGLILGPLIIILFFTILDLIISIQNNHKTEINDNSTSENIKNTP